MAFKLGSQKRNSSRKNINIPGSPIYRKKLNDGILAEANDDGSIYISSKVKPGSHEEKEVLKHEMKHITDMKVGKLAYGDDYVKYHGVTYPRKNGKIKYNGKWMHEGSTNFPWEKH